MRYKMIYRPQNVLSIKVDELVVESSTPLLEGPKVTWVSVGEDGDTLETLDGEVGNLVKDLFEIDGVAEVELKRYEITVRKGDLFQWKHIWRKILSAVQTNLAPMGDFFIAGVPVFAFTDQDGTYHEELIPDPDTLPITYYSSQPQ
ncbi:MAG: hypothetical protein UY26_C0003G0280 [Candidatus Jorgensenbacteria bacterium GW2011_GWA1_48_13]|uniref:Scaffold protein Nfu/NifU N-terminal domain-containing protein n=2 Tax=Candidatus Joergenseniibacteriota TaxID=1752739 RepID=A0A0G1YIK8_9BACT|nr:MAG: hypothetical protein UY26_C0003G0280 [Candidatus Jorgensenbacteria bacterium GW2011_GWA1_48_13]KKU97833.1 MAG: hypothetical protein UY32_C0039G0004 [Candidatus Jorgensenbacteria bacterium GW2011_GWC1_48_8]KKW14832.1 MAG: hypothetical protein UY55_C0003G0048 [Candidatus Jorgensenbacteria bacterium GW2011_GWB1_50_10]